MEQKTNIQAPAAEAEYQVDEIQLRAYLQKVRDNQNLPMAFVSGVAASAIGSIAWALITVWTNYQIGWMAIGVGFLVGYAVRLTGKGIDRTFGIMSAALSLVGCLAGNLLTVCVVISRQEGVVLLDLLSKLTLPVAMQLMRVTFQPMDVLFYAIAVYEGYIIAFWPITLEEVAKQPS